MRKKTFIYAVLRISPGSPHIDPINTDLLNWIQNWIREIFANLNCYQRSRMNNPRTITEKGQLLKGDNFPYVKKKVHVSDPL